MGVLKPAEILESCGNVGAMRARTAVPKTLMLAFLAGAYIAFGALLMVTVVAGLPQESFGTLIKFIGGALFPIGLIMVILGGADLFTGDVMYNTVGLIQGKMGAGDLFRNWFLAYAGNFLGAVFVVYLAMASGFLSAEPWLGWIQKIAVTKTSLTFEQAFWRGVGCNWLVCMACWLAMASDHAAGKVLGIWVPIMAFVTMGFEHSIANMFFIPAGIWAGAPVTWIQFWINNQLPVTLGNIVGGGLFVGVIYAFCYGNLSWAVLKSRISLRVNDGAVKR
ncbi:formate/nitrite transporter family protein [Desulfofundulus thermosubterraneus]|uniref:Formate/nitrite transporter n=1 Tax=Desulfofundulus thermosubterraneus DSM 16057 TaxID=1121432 RepID=A0A1M6LVZ4_9FIRM|nr:formate/nitrite transporter family protein [Desulfofundulus thermosubterraneus]SHJ75369.1 formate/nitrite transporter [Desulfofundulus thermosubterraneus DSM 16057]